MAWHTISSNHYSHDMQVLDVWNHYLATLADDGTPYNVRHDMVTTWPEMAHAHLDGAQLVITDTATLSDADMADYVADLTYWLENELPVTWWEGEPWVWEDDGTCGYCSAPWVDEHDLPCEDCADD